MQTPTLSQVLLPRASVSRDVLLIVGASILTALFARIAVPLPFSPVPVTGQTFAVLLIGAALGSKRGALAMLAYLAEGICGLPVFAGGSGGIAALLGPSGGYLFGFVPAAFITGWLAERGWDRTLPLAFCAMLLGNAMIYAVGLPMLAPFVGWDKVLALGLVPFVPGDIFKLVLAAVALPVSWRLVNSLRP
jgi:biotin transport system substrate-specific component